DNNCNDTIEKTIEIKKQAKAEFETKDVCENDSAVFINKSQDADEFLWKFGDGLAFGETSQSETVTRHKYQIPKTTTFLVTLVAKSGCSDSVTNPITVNQNPNSDFTYNQNGDKLELKAQSGYSQYKWKFNNQDSISVTTENYIHTLSNYSPIKICLQITDINNCTSQTCKTITLGIKQTVKSPNYKIYPNPNSGTFTIETQNNGGLEVQIFDVLGKEIQFEHDKTLSNFQIIKFSNSKGIYYIKLKQNGVVWVERVVVGE
ncbi:MAG: T9SS type A sorting domain-containing protein, partial [Bacteroidia bacterium]|nr:T9SS type A sorting domain-containing protein [Bacteroidia bacterium]